MGEIEEFIAIRYDVTESVRLSEALIAKDEELEAKLMRYKPVRIFDIEGLKDPTQELAIEAARKEGCKIIFIISAENELSLH